MSKFDVSLPTPTAFAMDYDIFFTLNDFEKYFSSSGYYHPLKNWDRNKIVSLEGQK